MDKHNCSCTNHNHAHEEQNISGIPHCCHNHETSCEVQNPLIKIIMSFVFLTAAITVRHIDFDFLKNIIENPNNLQKKLEVFFSLVSWLLCGRIVAINAVKNILKGKFFDEQFLMTIASLGAVLIGELPEAAAVMLFYQVGEFFQDKALDKSRDSINSLMKLRPDSAHLIENGTEKDVLPEDIKIGDIVIVRPGERIPVDGKIVSGRGFIDNSELTGESVPVECTEGYEVFSGTINKDGVLKIECTNIAGKSAAARILALVEEAQNKKAKTEKFISRFSKIYTPIVCIAALVVAVIPSLITKDYHTWIYKALMFLVVSCPCALVISVPLSFFSGIGLAGKKGILLKGSTCIENLANVKIAVFDKTGTLTKGSFTVTDVHCIKEIAPEELIKIAAHAEIHSNHPVSKSLRLAHNDECCRNVEILQQKEYSGMGIQTELEGKTILAGNERLMLKNKVSGYSPCEKKDIGTIIHIAIDGKYAGHIVISDVLKEDSLNAVKKLKKLGVNKIVMLTGDNEEAAQQAGKGAGIKEIYSTLLPEGKLTKIEELLESLKNKKGIQKGNLLFAGDGINDAPVLTRSDIGIAMGGLGADAAIEAADAVIMTDELSKIPMAIEISRKTLNIVYQNITISLAVKFAIMILGIFGIANMWFAVFGDVGVTFAAVLNASRLLIMGKNQK